MNKRVTLISICFLFLGLPFQTPAQSGRLIRERIDESRLRRLVGNTRPEANLANDRGRVADNLALDHILLQLQRPVAQQKALDQFIDTLHNPSSATFHRWLTPAEFGRQFGADPRDVDTITSWLQSHGLRVNTVYPNGMLIDFSGTAAQVSRAFHTEIHSLDVGGVAHIANMSDPLIPEALAPAVAGVVSLHDFKPRRMTAKRARPHFTLNGGPYVYEAVTPGDLATIYNLSPLFANGQTGTGQTIAVIEDADLFTARDWSSFRSAFGLDQYTTGSLKTVHPSGQGFANNCAIPGIGYQGDDSEAALDVEWASAAAPGAAIEEVSCASTSFNWGGFIALQNLINSSNPPQIMSISYGQCEAENGAAANTGFTLAFQQAVAEGISVFVAAGDEGAASCDAGSTSATHGIGVSGFASTAYNVAVGGNDFGDSVAGTNLNYWGSTNAANYTSALSYIPEIPWNDSCASGLLSGYFGYTRTYGASSFCASATGTLYYGSVVAGSGGPSNCATGIPASYGVSDGTCQGNPKPSWQSGPGVPNDGVRDIPDVSMFAADGVWGHYLVFCWSDLDFGGALCNGDPGTWSGAGGTSFSSPVMAGIQAIVNQAAGGPQGNPNYVYYQLAATSSCDSSNGDSAVSGCVFHNITKGDIDVNCGGGVNCYGSTSARFAGRGGVAMDGALSVSEQSFSPAYGSGGGWNFASGNGSVNAYNLVNAWLAATIPSGQ